MIQPVCEVRQKLSCRKKAQWWPKLSSVAEDELRLVENNLGGDVEAYQDLQQISVPETDVGSIQEDGEDVVTRRQISCITDAPAKKKSRIWRAWIRMTNRWRKFPKATKSVVVKEWSPW